MIYKVKEKDPDAKRVALAIEPVVSGLGFSILELSLSRHRGSAQVRMVLTRSPEEFRSLSGNGQRPPSIGTEDLGRAHRAVLPRLEAAMEGTDFSVECSSPGIDRTVKEGAEFVHFYGRSVRCFLPAESRWIQGVLTEADEKKITLETGDGKRELEYEYIAKAKLDG
jgi:ribosome maturation factor RimP